MKLFEFLSTYYDAFEGKYDYLLRRYDSKSITNNELIKANNQFLTDLINTHAKANLVSKYVSVNSAEFETNMARVFGDLALVKEVVKVGSNLSDCFGYCGFSSDSIKITDGFSLVIDSSNLAFSHNDVRSMSDLISRNIRFRKVVYVPTKFDPAYQLPTYSLFGVNFHIVPGSKIKNPFVEI